MFSARATLQCPLQSAGLAVSRISFVSFLRGTNSGVRQLTFSARSVPYELCDFVTFLTSLYPVNSNDMYSFISFMRFGQGFHKRTHSKQSIDIGSFFKVFFCVCVDHFKVFIKFYYNIASVVYVGCEACGILAPISGIEPAHSALEGEVSTPGKSRYWFSL